MFTKPCQKAEHHDPRIYENGELERNWLFYHIPVAAPSSGGPDGSQFRTAVVIDCEMGTALSGERELIQISAIDYFSGEVLINSLVWPDAAMLHYDTPFSGVSAGAIDVAHRAGACLRGRDGARRALFVFVGPATVVVGHGADNDLISLRWIHQVIIDSLILEKYYQEGEKENKEKLAAEQQQQEGKQSMSKGPRTKRPLSLKTLARERLGRRIQVRAHNSLEDAFATRDLVHWHIKRMLEGSTA